MTINGSEIPNINLFPIISCRCGKINLGWLGGVGGGLLKTFM